MASPPDAELRNHITMDALLGLQKLSVVNRVCTELKNHIGVNDKTLAEFIIDLVRQKGGTRCPRGTAVSGAMSATRGGCRSADRPDSEKTARASRCSADARPHTPPAGAEEPDSTLLPSRARRQRRRVPTGLCLVTAEHRPGARASGC